MMKGSNRGTRAAASLIRASHTRPSQPSCTECLYSKRSYSAATGAALKPTPSSSSQSPSPTTSPSAHTPTYKTFTGIVLSRPPLLTPRQSPFEKAFFFYQKRLNERLVMPFTRYFYFKKDTPADTDWKVKAKERNGAPAKELGGYNPYDQEEGWNDELLVKDAGLADEGRLRDVLVEDAKVRVTEGKEGEDGEGVEGGETGLEVKPLERRTQSDTKKERRMLDRELERTLYLVVKREGGGWGFPAGEVVGKEALHQTAERVLVQSAGLNMNTWLVGRVPIGHHVLQPFRQTKEGVAKEDSPLVPGIKTFFLKARIMAGQADLAENKFGLEDYRWLTKEEIEKVVGNKYWSAVKRFLHDR